MCESEYTYNTYFTTTYKRLCYYGVDPSEVEKYIEKLPGTTCSIPCPGEPTFVCNSMALTLLPRFVSINAIRMVSSPLLSAAHLVTAKQN